MTSHNKYFDTKEEAEKYKKEHEIYVKVPAYIACRNKWALIFPLKAEVEKEIK